MVTVAPGIFRAQGRGDRRVGKPSDAAELAGHDLPLEVQLARIRDMLPLASATLPEVPAGRSDPVRRGLQYLYNTSMKYTRTLAIYLRNDGLAREAIFDEHGAAVLMGERPSFMRHVFKRDGHTLRRVDSLIPSPCHHFEVYGSGQRPHPRVIVIGTGK